MMRRIARTLGWLLASLIIIMSAVPAQAAQGLAPAAGTHKSPLYNAPTSALAPTYGYISLYLAEGWTYVPVEKIVVTVNGAQWSINTNNYNQYNLTYNTGLWANPGDRVSVNLLNSNNNDYPGTPCTAWSGGSPALTSSNIQTFMFGVAWEDYKDMDCNDVYTAIGYAPIPNGWHDGNSGVQFLPNCLAVGWATDGYTEQYPVSVRALVDGVDVGLYGTANTGPRGDLTTSYCQTGYCGFSLNLYPYISYGVNHAITIQAEDNQYYNWYTIGGTPKTINCTEASYGSYFYSSPSPSNLLVGGSAVSMYSYHYSVNNGAGLNSVDYYVNCDPQGGTSGTWYYIGGTPFPGAPTTAYGSITLNPSSATSTCGGVLRGLHTFAENSYMVGGAYTGDAWNGSIWWMPWNYSTSQRTFTVLWDWDPPTTTPSYSGPAGSNGWYTGQVNVTLSAYDNPTDVPNSGLNTTNVKLPGWSGYGTYINPFGLTNQGANTIYYYSTDLVNNTEAVKNSTVYIDSVAPVSSYSLIGSGNSGWYTSTVTFRMSASDTNSGVWHKYVKLDAGSYQDLGAGGGPADYSIAAGSGGTHTISYYSVDYAGNAETPRTVTVKIDPLAPTTTATLTGTLGLNGWYTSSVQVGLSAADTGGSGLSATYLAGTAYTGPRTYTAQGTTSLQYYSTDVAGNQETPKTVTFKIDNVAPSSTYTLAGTLGASGWYTSPVTFYMSGSDATSGVGNKFVSLDAGAWQDLGAGPGPASFAVSAQGPHTLQYQARDNAGNYQPVQSIPINIDWVAPTTTATLSGTLGQNSWYTTSVQVTLSAADTGGSGLQSTTLDGTTYTGPRNYTAQGSTTITYYSTDVAGNRETAKTASFKIDTVAPSSTYTLAGTLTAGGWYTAPVTFYMSASDTTSGVWQKLVNLDGAGWQDLGSGAGPAGFAISTQGAHTLQYQARDNAGNYQAVQSFPVQLDWTPPTTTATLSGTLGQNGWYTSNVQVTLSAVDPTGSGIQSTTLDGTTYTSPRTYTAQGSTTITYYSTDVAGNRETPKTASFMIDSVAPTSTYALSGTLGAGGWYVSPVTFQMSASDATSGVWQKLVSLDGGAWQDLGSGPGPGTFTVSGQGSHTLSYQARDNAGNYQPVQYATINIDSVLPVTTAILSGTLGLNGWYVGPVQVSLSATDVNGSGISTTVLAGTVYSGPLTYTAQGTTTLSFYSVDIAGNAETPHSVSFQIDSVPPVSSYTLSGTLGNSGWYISPVQFTLSATDATSGVMSKTVYLNGTLAATTTGPGPDTISFTQQGMQTITYGAVDRAGNQESLKTAATIGIDTSLPMCLVGTPANGTRIWGTVSVGGSASDTGSGVASVDWSYDGGGTVKHISTSGGTSVSWGPANWDTTQVPDGFYQVGCRAHDVAGNTGVWSWITVQVNNIPTLSLTADYQYRVYLASTVGQTGQYLRGSATGGPGGPYTVTLKIESPTGRYNNNYTMVISGTVGFGPVDAHDVNFGTEEIGQWTAHLDWQNGTAMSNKVYWMVKEFPVNFAP